MTAAAERAGITKQAMGRLATELETTGYLRVDSDPNDARVKLTPADDGQLRSYEQA